MRLHTEEDGKGYGDYGYAASGDPLVADPLINPKADELENFNAMEFDFKKYFYPTQHPVRRYLV